MKDMFAQARIDSASRNITSHSEEITLCTSRYGQNRILTNKQQ